MMPQATPQAAVQSTPPAISTLPRAQARVVQDPKPLFQEPRA